MEEFLVQIDNKEKLLQDLVDKDREFVDKMDNPQ
jgi:hypothetical protein